MQDITIAVVQFCPEPGEINKNLEKMLHYMKQAASSGAGLVLFPEASLTGYSSEKKFCMTVGSSVSFSSSASDNNSMSEKAPAAGRGSALEYDLRSEKNPAAARDDDSSLSENASEAERNPLQILRSESDRLKIAVCFGYIERQGEQFFLTQELYTGGNSQSSTARSSASGVAGARADKTSDLCTGQSIFYRKTHLGFREKNVFSEGNSFPVIQISSGMTVRGLPNVKTKAVETQKPDSREFPETAPSLCCGMQLCWESHIPEISSALRAQGAELLLVPYASGMTGEKALENWAVHLPARASDNGAFLAACNLLFQNESDKTPNAMRGGGIAVYDPKGKRIAEYSGCDEHLLLCPIKGPLPRELPEGDMKNISYFDRKRHDLFEASGMMVGKIPAL